MTHDELVEKMQNAIQKAWWTFEADDDKHQRAILSAALDVAVEEMLGDVMNNEPDDVIAFVAARRSRYLKPKSAEERVTIHGGDGYWRVDLDNRCDAMFMKSSNYTRRHAETYRLGLIQQLKEQSK